MPCGGFRSASPTLLLVACVKPSVDHKRIWAREHVKRVMEREALWRDLLI
jgi:hypothetical protein